MSTFPKDPDEVLDYKFDWSSWLASGETISTATLSVESGLTKDSDSITDSSTSVTVWLSGGTAGQKYTVSCKITTSDSRTAERTLNIRMQQR